MILFGKHSTELGLRRMKLEAFDCSASLLVRGRKFECFAQILQLIQFLTLELVILDFCLLDEELDVISIVRLMLRLTQD